MSIDLDVWAIRKQIHPEAWYSRTQHDAEGWPRAFGGHSYQDSMVRAANYAKRYGGNGKQRRRHREGLEALIASATAPRRGLAEHS